MKTFISSVCGPANRERGISNQDAAMLRRFRNGLLAVVCDGLGSCTKSAWGARQACRAAKSAIENITLWFDTREFCELLQEYWLRYIEPAHPTDVATTCLIAFVEGSGATHIAQIGDGMMLCRSKGVFKRLTPERQGFSDQTCALSSELRYENWVFFECDIANQGDGVLLMSDGISEDLDHSRLEDFFASLYEDALRLTEPAMRRMITRQLYEWPTPGHSDDKTIAGIYRT